MHAVGEPSDWTFEDGLVPSSERQAIDAAMLTLGVATFVHNARIAPLEGGASNHNYLVSSAERSVVLRIASPPALSKRFALDRWRGFGAHQAAVEAGSAPPLRAIALPTGHSVTDYVEGRVLDAESILEGTTLERATLALRSVHALAHRVRGEFNGLAEIDRFIRICRDEAIDLPSDIDELHDVARRIEALFVDVGAPEALCHNDVQIANLIRDDDGRVWVIDWEYGGLGNFYFDLAMLTNNAELDAGGVGRVLTAYFGVDRPCDRARIRLNRFQSAMREALWSLVAKPVLGSTGWDYDAWAARFFASVRDAWSSIQAEGDLITAGPATDDGTLFERMWRT